MDTISDAFAAVAHDVDRIDLIDEHLAPDGLMKKARSISWLVEQVYVQQLAHTADDLNLASVHAPDNDLLRYDVVFELPDNPVTFYTNIKTGLVESGTNKNDVTKADKLAAFYHTHDADIAYLVVDVRIDLANANRTLVLRPDAITTYNIAWLPQSDIYVNGTNRNLQARLDRPVTPRSIEEFLTHLVYGTQGILEQEPTISVDDALWDRILDEYAPDDTRADGGHVPDHQSDLFAF